jgi:hypothetical protein
MKSQFNKFTKKQLVELINTYGRLSLVLDSLWFLAIEERVGFDVALDLDVQVWKKYGLREAKLLKKVLSISEPNLSQVKNTLLTSPFSCTLDYQTKIDGDGILLSVANCLPQKARVRDGRGEFPCKQVGIAYYGEFFKELNPNLQVKCLFCPPDEHPQDLWCSWKITKSEWTPLERTGL